MSNLISKVKAFWYVYRKELLAAFALALVSSLSFAAGYLFAAKVSGRPIIIERCAAPTQ